MKEYPATEQGYKEWEQNYEDGDVIAYQALDPFDIIAQGIQLGAARFPANERYYHIEPIYDAEVGMTVKANGTEVARANVDDERNRIFEKKSRMVIFRAMPMKTPEQLTLFKKELIRLLYVKYDKLNLIGHALTSIGNFFRWLTHTPEHQNVVGDADKPVCSTVALHADRAAGYKICEEYNAENVNPTILVHDKTYQAIAAIGGKAK